MNGPVPATSAIDPRTRQDGLGWVTRALFDDPGVRLAVGDDPAATLRYAVIPALGSAKFLLPLASRRVTAASVLAYNALRPPRVRASRAAVGTLARLGLLGVTQAPVLSVYAQSPSDLLPGFLGARLGATLHAAIGIRPPDPHHKPTLQLFDDSGTPRGYAKIGWNDGTRAMVRAEAATLGELPTGGGFPPAPRLVLHTRWRGREIAVIEPMPRDVTAIDRPEVPRLDAMLAVARRGGPATAPRPVAPLIAAWRRRAEGSPDPRIHRFIDALDTGLAVELGFWHGDWVPWNMALHRGRLLVWDWENAGYAVPVGFDLAHQAFQTSLSTLRRPAAECAAAVDAALAEHGPRLGVAHPRFVADAYLVELWLRTYELSGGGAGWNARLHPALLDVLAARLGH